MRSSGAAVATLPVPPAGDLSRSVSTGSGGGDARNFRRLRRMVARGKGARSSDAARPRPTIATTAIERSIRTRQMLLDMTPEESNRLLRPGDDLINSNKPPRPSTKSPTARRRLSPLRESALSFLPTISRTSSNSQSPPRRPLTPTRESSTESSSSNDAPLSLPGHALTAPPPRQNGRPGAVHESGSVPRNEKTEGRPSWAGDADCMNSEEFTAWLTKQEAKPTQEGPPPTSNNHNTRGGRRMPERMSSTTFINWLSTCAQNEANGPSTADSRPALSTDARMTSQAFLKWLDSQH